MSIEKAWFFEYGMREGFDAGTLINVTDPGFAASAKKCCNHEEGAYVDKCVEFQISELRKIKGGCMTLPPPPRLFHIVLIDDLHKRKQYQTRYAMPQEDCIRVRDKYSPLQSKHCRHLFEPLYKFTPHHPGEWLPIA